MRLTARSIATLQARRARRGCGDLGFQPLGLLGKAGPALRDRLLRHDAQALARGEKVSRALGADLAERDERPVEDDGEAQRADREPVLVMPDAERAFGGIEGKFQLALVEGVAVAVAEEGHDELAVGAEPLPVDVEGPRVGRELAPFERRQPGRVVGAADAHVVRHDVEDEAEAVLPQRVGETVERRLAAELRVDRAMVDDVVAVGRARPRPVDRRGVDMADPEPREIRHDRCRVVEGEVLVELQTVGRARRRRGERVRARACAAAFRRHHGRDFASGPPGAATVSRSLASLRRQFGCSSCVPGMFGWFSSPSTSSYCTALSAEGVRAR